MPDDMTAPAPRSRRIIGYAVKIAISAGLICWLSRRVAIGHAFAILKEVSWAAWIVVTALTGVALLLGGLRWHALTGGFISRRICLAFTWMGQFYGMVLPGLLLGDIAKAAALATGDKAQRTLLLPFSVLLDRLLGLAALVVVGFASLAGAKPPAGWEGELWQVAMLSMGAAVLIGVALGPRIAITFSRRVEGWSWLPERVGSWARGARGLFMEMRYTRWLAVMAVSILIHLVTALSYACAARAVGIPADVWKLGMYYAAVNLVLMLPVTIAGIGAREQVSLAFLASASGSSMPVALSWIILVANAVHALVGAALHLTWWLRLAPASSPQPTTEDGTP